MRTGGSPGSRRATMPVTRKPGAASGSRWRGNRERVSRGDAPSPESATTDSRAFRILRRELHRGIPRILGLLALMVAGTGLGLLSPLLFKTLIDKAIPAKD